MTSSFTAPHKAEPRKPYSKIPHVLELPNLIQIQLDSFRRFCDERPDPEHPAEKGGAWLVCSPL